MPLNNTQLRADLIDILSYVVPSPSAAAAGVNWGTAYNSYALTGTAMGVPPIIGPALTTALQTALGSAFTTLPGVPATVAAAISAALGTFWIGVVFTGATGPPVPGGAAALISALTSIFSNVGGTATSKATEIRDALSAYTGAVLVPFVPIGTFPVV